MYNRSPFKFLSYAITMLPTTPKLKDSVRNRNLAMNWLLEHFPKAFDLGNRKPLKDDILTDIIGTDLPKVPDLPALHAALHYYTQWGSYLQALKAGAVRVGLYGEAVGQVGEDEAMLANKTLKMAGHKFS